MAKPTKYDASKAGFKLASNTSSNKVKAQSAKTLGAYKPKNSGPRGGGK